MGKRELVALLNLSSWCLVMVEWLFLAVPRGCLRFAIVVFPDQTHSLFLQFKKVLKMSTCLNWEMYKMVSKVYSCHKALFWLYNKTWIKRIYSCASPSYGFKMTVLKACVHMCKGDYSETLSYAPLIKWKLLCNEICYFYSETTSVKRIYNCISNWNFVVIRWETSRVNGSWRTLPSKHHFTLHYFETHITLHFFQGRISAMPEIRADLSLAVSKAGMCLLTLSVFKRFTILVPSLPRFEKSLFYDFF